MRHSVEDGTHNAEVRISVHKDYVVSERDTLWSIAKMELGITARYVEIVAENRLQTATLHKGMVLKLPTNGGAREG